VSKDSVLRKMKRQAMIKAGLTFSQRLTEWVRTGTPVDVVFEWDQEKRNLIAKKK
jgi:hypothetical protein